ncbi:MAG TPA: hypothetical protein VLC10_04045 [Patescibacteria group bacterium]|nr:hypothetical protein [Patescibacteria group bacterium]
MNLFKVITLFVAGTARELANEGKETVRLTKNLLILSVLAPLMLLILGVGLGALGESLDSMGTVGVGQALIIVAGFSASLLLAFVLIRATVLGYVLVAGSKLASVAFQAFPDLKNEEVTSASRKLAGVMAFITGASLYAQVVPIWRAVGVSLIAATSMMGLAYIMAAGWYNGKWAKVALTSFMLLSLAFSTARIASPRFARGLAEFSQRNLGSDHLNDDDHRLLVRLTEERNAIRHRAVENCSGRYCTAEDARRVLEIEQDIARLQNGTYWENAGRNVITASPASPAVQSQTVPPVVNPDRSSSSADLPPPPVVPRRDPPPATTVEQSDVAPTADPHTARHARPRTDRVFRELDNYPDLLQ